MDVSRTPNVQRQDWRQPICFLGAGLDSGREGLQLQVLDPALTHVQAPHSVQ
jgi:hypothetical protein